MTNIVSFPRDKIVRDFDQNSEELIRLKSKSIQNLADGVTDDIAETIYETMKISGVDMDNEEFTKDFHFLVTILNATIYRTMKLEHRFHKFIDENVVYMESTENDVDTPN